MNKPMFYFSLVFILNLWIFSLGNKPFKSVDTIGTRLIPVSILNEFNMDLDEFFGPPENYLEERILSSGIKYKDYFLEIAEDGSRYYHPWYITVQKNKFYTSYPIVYPILNLPFYLIAKLLGLDFKVTISNIYEANSWINKLDSFIAAFWTAIGSLFLFIKLYREVGVKHALIINLIYCLATPAFSLLSHNTWQHTLLVACLFLVLFLLDIENKNYHYITGILLGLLPFIRPTGIFFYPLVFLAKKKFWKEWIICVFIPVLIFLSIHMYMYSHPLGGYYPHVKMVNMVPPSISFYDNFIGLLFSPSRGLFPFMPYLILTFIFILYLAFKRRELRKKIIILSIPFFLHFIYYSGFWSLWHGGTGYGPRFLSDNLPIFMIFISIVFIHFQRYKIFNILMGFLLFVSFLIHLQPNISDKFQKWESCYHHPLGYVEKLMNWSNPVFLAHLKDIRLLWREEVTLDYNDLCFIHERVNRDGSVSISESDFKEAQLKFQNQGIFLDKYYLVYMKDFYFPKGNYELQILDYSQKLYFSFLKQEMNTEKNLKEGNINFYIDKSKYYSFIVFSKEPINYTFYYIKLKKLHHKTN